MDDFSYCGIVRRRAHAYELIFDATDRVVLRTAERNLNPAGEFLLEVALKLRHTGFVDLEFPCHWLMVAFSAHPGDQIGDLAVVANGSVAAARATMSAQFRRQRRMGDAKVVVAGKIPAPAAAVVGAGLNTMRPIPAALWRFAALSYRQVVQTF